ncbi:diguanylate cyclase [Alteromonadales bacterium alter-6D02]|nr:diguanylate cyclase [Alteromonadales bacterium alter-6D02]
MMLNTQLVKLFLFSIGFFITIVIPLRAESQVSFSQESTVKLPDFKVWRAVNLLEPAGFKQIQQAYYQSKPLNELTIGSSGAYIARVPLENSHAQARSWYASPSANFIDAGVAYWKRHDDTLIKLNGFSQTQDINTPVLMHNQAVGFTIEPYETGELWLYVNAKHYATPLHLTIYNQPAFYRLQLVENTVTIAAITVMLTLALIALLVFIRTRLAVTIACAGYIGLHGLGWAAASGLIDDILLTSSFNFSYLGIYLFPVAIACACQFTKLLFIADTATVLSSHGPIRLHKTLTQVLDSFAVLCCILAFIMLWLDFSSVFLISHLIAMFWIPLAIFIGFKMLYVSDFRAKYFLFGNSLYCVSLLYYVLSHTNLIEGLTHPELIVMVALAIDCICILLSLSEWLRLQQLDYKHQFSIARIDSLTQIANRYALNESLAKLSRYYAIVFIDLDGMKQINDQLGHAQGDAFLIKTSQVMSQRVAEYGQVFRTGGDEFVWLFNTVTKKDLRRLICQTKLWVEQCEGELQQTWPFAGVSYGIADSIETDSTSACLTLADERMYHNKQGKVTADKSEWPLTILP